VLNNATRRIPKATYVPINIPTDDSTAGRAFLKVAYVRQMKLQPGETAAVHAQLATSKTSSAIPWKALQQFEGNQLPSQSPAPSAFAKVPPSALLAFGKAVVAIRQKSLSQLRQQTTSASSAVGAVVTGVATVAKKTRAKAGGRTTNSTVTAMSAPAAQASTSALGQAISLANSATGAVNAFEASVSATPIGYLNLERLEMTPAGIERGELLATIPLAPKEQTAVVQKEWSVTTQEFTSIVTDSLENYSETGVTENTDLSQSTTSQTQHGNQFNITGTVSGGIGLVSGSVSSGFSSQDSNSQSAADSRTHAIQTTRKASARVKQEHKMTISTTTVTGASESSTRILQNPSPTDPMRIDYFSLMRKWRVQLYRYDARLTYDIGIPEPGGALREAYMKLDDLQSRAGQVFAFPLQYSDITPQAYYDPSSTLWSSANQYGVPIQPPPGGSVPGQLLVQYVPSQTVPTPTDPNQNYYIASLSIPFTVADGQQIENIEINYNIGENNAKWVFHILGYDASGSAIEFNEANCPVHGGGPYYQWNVPNQSLNNFMKAATGSVAITVQSQFANPFIVSFNVYTVATADAVQAWQSSVYSALYNAAQTAFYANQQVINSQIQALQDKINNVDTLTLRREENEEIMKGVLRWLLGPTFDFMPQEVVDLFKLNTAFDTSAYDLLTHGVSFTGNELVDPLVLPGGVQFNLPFTSDEWSVMFQYQEMVKFINQAIEWENVMYFLYSYFWDVPVSWDFIRQIQHPDAIRQAFLRAGSARVVLTVRKGWENAWINFVEAGGFGQTLLPHHPYLTIANEIQDYDDTNYPGIPPANPDAPLNDADSVATSSNAKVGPSQAAVTIPVASSKDFVVGYTAVIDTYDSGVQESAVIVDIPDATHITIAAPPQPPGVPTLQYAHDGTTIPFPVLQPGEKGQLIGQWYEYTPTSGTDIAVTTGGVTRPTLSESNLGTIA
jgi:hypothetical protein